MAHIHAGCGILARLLAVQFGDSHPEGACRLFDKFCGDGRGE